MLKESATFNSPIPIKAITIGVCAVLALGGALSVNKIIQNDSKIADLKAQASLPITAVVVKAGTTDRGLKKIGLEFRVTDSKQIEVFKIALQTVKDLGTNRAGNDPIELTIEKPDGSKFTVPGRLGRVYFSIESTDPMTFNCSLDSKHPGDLRCLFDVSGGLSAGGFRTKGLHTWIRNLGPSPETAP